MHGDVFRPPKYGSLFAVLVGTGYQVGSVNVLKNMPVDVGGGYLF